MGVIVVGAGGLGGPVALILGASGIDVTVIDPDVVELSNLPRQVQFTDADLGAFKATTLAARVVLRGGRATGLVARWPHGEWETDLLVDASDDPATKFAVSDACVARGLPYVIASALRYGGNVMIGAPGAACYRCIFEDPPIDAPTCSAVGVLGPIVGVIGAVAAAHALHLAAGDTGEAGSIHVFDDVRFDRPPRVVRFARRAGCPACAGAPHHG